MVHLNQITHLNPSETAEFQKEIFAQDLERPCFIIGNGPSCADVQYVPKNAIVFRMNWFFLEEGMPFGSQVDGFFYSAQDEFLISNFAKELSRGEYSVARMFSPLRCLDTPPVWPEMYDHWTVLAENQSLARYLMSRPLPTQGLQVFAYALCLGFKQIHLLGLDLYQNKGDRYAYKVHEMLSHSMKAKDVSAGYEEDHNLDVDLRFLDTILAQFPGRDIRLESGAQLVEQRLNTYREVWKIPPMPQLKPSSEVEQEPLISDSAPSDEATAKKYAFVTFVDGDYYHGARALANSLSKVSDHKLIIMHTSLDIPSRLKLHANVEMMRVEPIANPNRKMNSARFKNVYTKLRVFEHFMDYERVCFIDADTLVLKSVNELFETYGFAACPDLGLEQNLDTFNSGVFVFTPSTQLKNLVFDAMSHVGSYDGGDQGLLNNVLKDWTPLDVKYNTLKRIRENFPLQFNLDDIHVLHFVGEKPWSLLEHEMGYMDIERKWLEYLSLEEIQDLVAELRFAKFGGSPYRRLSTDERYRRIQSGVSKWCKLFASNPGQALKRFSRVSAVLWNLVRSREPESRDDV